MSQTGNSQGSFELQTAEGVALPRTPVWAMIPGVVVAAFVLDFVVSWLRRGTLPRFGLVLVASSLLFTAVMVCGFVVRAICARVVPGHRRLDDSNRARSMPYGTLDTCVGAVHGDVVAADDRGGRHLPREPGLLPETMRS